MGKLIDNPTDSLEPETLRLIEEISRHYEKVYDLSRIGCRILALLLINPKPTSMASMGNCLKVSQASISTNLRLLSALGYVEKITYPGDRSTYFRFLPRSRVRVLRDRIGHYQDLKHIIKDAKKETDFQSETLSNLDEMLDWAELAIKMNTEFIKEWEVYIRSNK